MACSFGTEGVGNGQQLGQGDDDDDATSGSPMNDTGANDGIPPTTGDDDDDSVDGTGDDDDDTGDDDDDSSSDGPSEPVCGNRIVEDDEICDDGNDIDHDGCTTACQESGSQIFGHAFPGDPATFEAMRAVAFHPDLDTYFGVGFVWSGTSYDTIRVEVGIDGVVHQEQVTDTAGDQVDNGVAVSPGGDLAIVGREGNVFRVDQVGTDLAIVDTDMFAGFGVGEGMAWSVAFEPGGAFLAVGSQPRDGSAAFAQKFDASGVGSSEGAIANSLPEYFRAVVWDEDTNRYYCAYNISSGDDTIVTYDATLGMTSTIAVDTPGESTLRSVAVTEDSIIVAGYYDVLNADTAFVDSYSLAGNLQWRYETEGDEGEAFFLAMEVDGEGSIVAGGYQPVTIDELTGQPQRIIHKLEPDGGTLLWSKIVEVEDNPIGSVQDLTIGPGNVIFAVGTAGPAGTSTGPAAYALNP